MVTEHLKSALMASGILYPSGGPPRIFIEIPQNDQYSHNSIRLNFMKLLISMKVTIAIKSTAL
jgi:hypothetical protein